MDDALRRETVIIYFIGARPDIVAVGIDSVELLYRMEHGGKVRYFIMN